MKLMHNRCSSLRRFILLATASIAAYGSPSTARAAPETKPVRDGHVVVQAFTDRQALSPGGSLDLAVLLKMDKGWHTYWASPGGSVGLPTVVEWSGPKGLRFDHTRYPVPKTHYDKTIQETSFVLEDEAVLITTVHVPQSLGTAQPVTLKAKISWLVCKETCIPGEAEVTLTLPVRSTGQQAAPANEKLFAKARRALPEPMAKAQHLKLAFETSKQPVKPGDQFTLTLTAELAPHHHMQSNKPMEPELIPALLFVEQTEGLEIGGVGYPAGQVRVDKVLGKLSEYSGKLTLRVPVSVADDADKAGRWIRAVFQYQICNDAGTCYPPQRIFFAVPVQMQGGLKPAAEAASTTSSPPPDQGASQDAPTAPLAPDASHPEPPLSSMPRNGSNQNLLQRLETYLLTFGYAGALVVAMLGGFILNLMPCVLPVISLKILSFVRQAHQHRARVFWLGMTYAAGILLFFAVIALVYYYTNRQYAWGELFQRPHVVLGLAAVVTAFSLSLFGVWTVFTTRVINKLGEKAEGEGFSSAFATGLLATFLGTACTAPFLSAAIGAASKFSPAQGALIFPAVGLGMASPFILLAANPAWLRFVPRPGPWMLTFEYLMGFLLLGTVVWLINPLRNQIGGEGLLLSLIFLIAVGLAAWIKGRILFDDPLRRKLTVYALSLLILALGWILPFRVFATVDELRTAELETQQLIAEGQVFRRQGGGKSARAGAYNLDWSRGIPWQRYRRSAALEDVKSGYTVFIDYTADWCANCKTLLKTAIERPEVIKVMRELKVVPYTADYTLPVAEIKDDLRRFQRGGVPMFLVYKGGDPDHPEVLPEVITTGLLIDALRRAGPSQVSVAQAP